MNWPRIILDGLAMSLLFNAVAGLGFLLLPQAYSTMFPKEIKQAAAPYVNPKDVRTMKLILYPLYRAHTDMRIFPSAAVYLTAKESLGEKEAFAIVENAAVELTNGLGKKLAALMRVPGVRPLFIRMWDPLTRKIFGPDNGFKNRFYPKKKGEYRMDVLACPYCRYFTELVCPELTRIYCENDERTYGNLPGIVFERTGTLGKGADRCDFCIRKA